MSSSFLDLYEPLDVIGNGSFGIIRKVRRKSDGIILARKELNFERMSERDRKQIVAEVNILKDLDHPHIVRYHDRHVDREAGMLYILMEYCGGGDLSTVINLAQKHGRPISEEMVWNYFMQILLALQYCHHPHGHARTGSTGSDAGEGRERRAQILHRDLKPDNVFLDENNDVKLGDFGLSKALTQASLANTYVGTPYYMSPELMQEKAYDSKSDIWSLGCLIYELCALRPPFHEAKTHSELSIHIRNGRIPPLPRGYSQALSAVIKSMLNLNPAMRPSAAQLMQHEKLEHAYKVFETQKLFNSVKTHKALLIEKERELLAREATLATREANQASLFAQKEAEVASLKTQLNEQSSSIDVQIQQAIAHREVELRAAVLRREEEVAEAMRRREEEIMDAVRRREVEIEEAWRSREAEVREECEKELAEQWKSEWEKVEKMREEVEERVKSLEATPKKGTAEHFTLWRKTPLEEVKNILAPLAQLAKETQPHHLTPCRASARQPLSAFETPANRQPGHLAFPMASAMKGVILTETGEPIATPTPAQLVNFFVDSPKGGLGFAKIFDFDKDEEDSGDETENRAPPSSPSKRRGMSTAHSAPAVSSDSSKSQEKAVPTTRLRRPSLRPSAQRPSPSQHTLSEPSTVTSSSLTATGQSKSAASVSANSVSNAMTGRPQSVRSASTPAPPVYDLKDEENLPSPFLKKIDRERIAATVPASGTSTGTSVTRVKRPSGGNLLRAVAAANSANAGRAGAAGVKSVSASTGSKSSVRKAGEEARKALLRT
ncbi:kinase-like protein [Artomyces pyxidatus]|uniref:Kinase-like protein n=1 Tax=Artomyces pyxidatus TaxID=48021 RepID=A0ACB8SSM3_9AGAM|nr:kinase-like protein [Artomyces pyxidatus]